MASLGGFAGLIKHLKMKTRKALKDMQAQRVIVSIRTADNYHNYNCSGWMSLHVLPINTQQYIERNI